MNESEKVFYRVLIERTIVERAVRAVRCRGKQLADLVRDFIRDQGSAVLEQPTLVPDPNLEAFASEVHGYYCQVMSKDRRLYQLTAARRMKLKVRYMELRSIFHHHDRAVQAAKVCIDQCFKSDWHMGRTAATGGRKVNDLIIDIFGTYERMERWLQ